MCIGTVQCAGHKKKCTVNNKQRDGLKSLTSPQSLIVCFDGEDFSSRGRGRTAGVVWRVEKDRLGVF